MLKVILGVLLLLTAAYFLIRYFQKKEQNALDAANEKLAREKERAQVNDVREEIVDVLGENVKREKRLNREERKYAD